MIYLITGSSGFIGHKVALNLLEAGHTVVGVDNMNSYYDVKLKEHRLGELKKHSDFIFYKVDIDNIDALKEIFEKYSFDGIINLAARAGVVQSMKDPHAYLRTNTQGTLNLLDLAVKNKVKKFVLASTSSLYAGQSMPFCETLSVNEPLAPYPASKKSAEAFAYCYHYLYDLDISVLRYFTVFGPAGRPDLCIFRFIKWIDEGHPIELFGDGSQTRDFTYLDDVASATVAALKPVGYEVINVGGGRQPISLNTVISFMESKLGKKAIIDQKPFFKADMKETWADISKAERLLGWRPKTDVMEGLGRTIDWYLEHRSWLSKVQLPFG